MKKLSRILSVLIVVLILTALLPVSAYAQITKVEPPPITWVELDGDGNPHLRSMPGQWNGEVLCDGIPGELVDIETESGTTTIFIRKTIDDQYLYSNEIWAKRIRCADENSTLKINAENWYSLNVFVAEAIAKRQDVTVEFGYLDYETQERVGLTIPAGTDLAALMDGKEVIQFKDLAEKLGVEPAPYEE